MTEPVDIRDLAGARALLADYHATLEQHAVGTLEAIEELIAADPSVKDEADTARAAGERQVQFAHFQYRNLEASVAELIRDNRLAHDRKVELRKTWFLRGFFTGIALTAALLLVFVDLIPSF